MTDATTTQQLEKTQDSSPLSDITVVQINDMKINDLRSLAGRCKLPTGGNTQELQSRLMQAKLSLDPPADSSNEGFDEGFDEDLENKNENQAETPPPADTETPPEEKTDKTPPPLENENEDQDETPAKPGPGRPRLIKECKFCKSPVRVKKTETIRVDDNYIRKQHTVVCEDPKRHHRYPVAGPREYSPVESETTDE